MLRLRSWGLVDHEDRILGKRGIELHLLEEDAVGHYLYPGGVVGTVLKTHLVADDPGHGHSELAGYELRSPRLPLSAWAG